MEGERKNQNGGGEFKDKSVKSEFIKDFREICNVRTLFRDVVNGFVFWSLFQALAPMIWFYPLNELEISGYEAFAVAWLSPILCLLPGFLPLIQNRWFLGLLRLASVAALWSFQAPTTLHRLVILAAGAGISALVLAATLFSPSQRIRCQTYWSLTLGLLVFVTSRVWYVSFVPTWWSSEANTVVISLGLIACLEQIFSGSDAVEESEVLTAKQRPRWPLAGLGLGGLLYLTVWCFGEVSIITRWAVTGYPDTGPQPSTWGAPVLVCLALGVFVSEIQDIGQSYVWTIFGTVAIGILYYLPTWQAYAGGLLLAVFTMSVWPRMVNQASACPPGPTLALANLLFIVFTLFHVWTVAYNFVPGGVFTREHSDWLIAAVMLCIALGLHSGGKVSSGFTALASLKGIQFPTGLHRAVVLLTLVLGLLGFGYRFELHRHDPPQKAKPREFKAAIWTYHFGYDNQGWPSLERSAWLLNNTGADVITLLESDASKSFLGNNDLGMWLGERLDMYVDFGVSTRDHTWGNLILSKYPIIKSRHHLLPSPHGELAPAITATINISGEAVDFVVTHMGNDRDKLDRKLQAQFLAKELKNCSNPAVFMGYVTSAPGNRDYKQLTNGGGVKDIDPTDLDRWCEYIMYKNLIRLGYARITHGGLSDTEVQMGHFLIPEDKDNFKDNTQLTTDPTKVDTDRHFNPVFGKFYRGHGHFKHHGFHMNTPKYFLP